MNNLNRRKFENVHILLMSKYHTFADPNSFEEFYDRASLIHPYWNLYSDDYQAQIIAEMMYEHVMHHKQLIVD